MDATVRRIRAVRAARAARRLPIQGPSMTGDRAPYMARLALEGAVPEQGVPARVFVRAGNARSSSSLARTIPIAASLPAKRTRPAGCFNDAR